MNTVERPELVEMTLSELAAADDIVVGPSPWVEITQDRIDAFAGATGDRQWVHIDPERAAAGPFGGTIAHGYLILSLLPSMLGGLVTVSDATMGLNYGLDRLRLVSPVPVGSRVRASGRIVTAEPKAGGIRYTLDVTVEIEGGDRPALVATVIYMVFG